MAKKSEEVKTEQNNEKEEKSVCQYCRSHCNHPSMCKLTGKYVGRKQEACEKFKEAK